MSSCKTLIRTSFSILESKFHSFPQKPFYSLAFRPPIQGPICPYNVRSKQYGTIQAAISVERSNNSNSLVDDNEEESSKDNVEKLLTNGDDVMHFMKMERRCTAGESRGSSSKKERWFPYLDRYKCGDDVYLSSSEVVEAVGPYLMEERKERFVRVARNRSYSVCLVVEGLRDFGNVSAAFRSADALGVQSVHVVSCDSSKRYRENRHVSMGAEKWLDIELWDTPQECFEVLRSRGYRIATTHVGMDAVSIYDMDWSCPTAIVVGNENRGISNEALQLSDLHCSIPMKGMVDSFNVSVAAGILLHHAVCDRVSRLGGHGDLTSYENQILLAEFSLRHSKSAISIAHEYAKRRAAMLMPKL
ncbi:hypothetical protein LWI28_004686 [Acer negundo]|uniref:tRNA/rRNA methyltransferase SpoU type domain-containing protein n=1 Tax=Acer negundo TaxID=4023 RepID=A0AAD5I5M2_ACENE|nr:hypothetical protein LWI28_004686 [Acer negundo]KAK4833976.1 hypothetical protein QYF36_014328 [Acer negundo]